MLSAFIKIIAKMNLEGIKQHIESLIDKKELRFHRINFLRTILKKGTEFRSPSHLLIDFEKPFKRISRELFGVAIEGHSAKT